jgi:hypothetical protein
VTLIEEEILAASFSTISFVQVIDHGVLWQALYAEHSIVLVFGVWA